MKIEPDDPILTSYALGELDSAERSELETRLRESPAACQALEEIQATANLLTVELAREPLPRLTAEQRKLIDAAVQRAPENIVRLHFWQQNGARWGLAVAACVAGLLILLPGQLTRNQSADLFTDPSVPKNPSLDPAANTASPIPATEVSDKSNVSQTAIGLPKSIADTSALIAPANSGRNESTATRPTMEPRLASRSGLRSPTPPPTDGPKLPSMLPSTEDRAGGGISQPVAPTVAQSSLGDAPTTTYSRPADSLGLAQRAGMRPATAPPSAPSATKPAPEKSERERAKSVATAVSEIETAGKDFAQAQRFANQGIGEAIPRGGLGGGGPLGEARAGEGVRAVPSEAARYAKSAVTKESLLERRFGFNPAERALPQIRALSEVEPQVALRDADTASRSDWYERGENLARANTASYPTYIENSFRSVLEEPLSTFSTDVDTASYANVRRFLNQGLWPPRDAVRIEELINYFTYDYPQPHGDHPFSVNLEVAGCPWSPGHRLVRVGLKGREIQGRRPPSNFVFLIDVSGSMAPPERLPLIKQALRQLVRKMTATDRVAVVVYASSSGQVLPSTSCAEKETILAAIDRLEAGGSTNGGEGIQRAYNVASEHFIQGGVNRVMLCTDGDFNVGVTSQDQLIRLIQEKARSGVFLTTLGVGTDNYKDALMQKLADKGNGNYHYLDSIEEAHKVLIEQMNANLVTIAKDVKIQIEFNPAQVSAYRLIGYEKRVMRNQDFHNDRKDAGEIGAGHTVTAIYEIVPAGLPQTTRTGGAEPLKYQPGRRTSGVGVSADGSNPTPVAARGPTVVWDASTGQPLTRETTGELLTLKLRFKKPDANESELIEFTARDEGLGFSRASGDFRFAAAVAQFGMLLQGSQFRAGATWASTLEIAQGAKGRDDSGYRSEFLNLIRKAKALRPQARMDEPGREERRAGDTGEFE